MKKLLFFLSILLISLQSIGQGLQYVEVNPSFPTESDSISVMANYVFNSGLCGVDHQNYTITGNDIITYHYHCPGMLAVICVGTDILPIGVLPAGSYTLTSNLFQGEYDSLGNCGQFTQIDVANFNFTVSLGTGVNQITKAKPIVFLNKENIKISNLLTEYQFSLYDVTGKEIISRKVSTTDNDFYISVESGVYFYSLHANGAQEFTGKLVFNE